MSNMPFEQPDDLHVMGAIAERIAEIDSILSGAQHESWCRVMTPAERGNTIANVRDKLEQLRRDLAWLGGGESEIVRTDTVVQTFTDNEATITIYESFRKSGIVFVAADQAGWLDGSWATPEEALQAALQTGNLQR